MQLGYRLPLLWAEVAGPCTTVFVVEVAARSGRCQFSRLRCQHMGAGPGQSMVDRSTQMPLRQAPGPDGLVTLAEPADPLRFLAGLLERYGDVVRYRTQFGLTYLFVRPEHVDSILSCENYRRASLVKMMLGEGVLAADGPGWRQQRRLMQKDFHPARIRPFVGRFAAEVDRTAQDWRARLDSRPHIDLTDEMTRLTLRIVVATLFSEDLSEEREAELCGAITTAIHDLGAISWTVFGVPLQFSPHRNASFNAAKKIVDDTSYEMIARRRASANRPPDLLTMLIEAETADGPLDDIRLRDEMASMLIGGHETTALALTWAWKLLSEHPQIELRLHNEIDRVLGGRKPTVDDLSQLRWTGAIFNEAMRLYPPVWYMARVAAADDVIDGYAIPAGACVLISAYFTQRHPEFWPEPERFNPRRFLHNEERSRHRCAFFPFGGGRHKCLGMHFASMEAVVVLAHLAQWFRIRPIDARAVQPDPGITLRQKPNIVARLELRHR
jgi:cytochrome P450